MKILRKKGVSGVIVTVLLVLITLAVLGILISVIIPFVKNNLNKSSSCIGKTDGISIVSEDTCYLINETKIGVRFDDVDSSSVKEIYIMLETDAGSETFTKEGGQLPDSGGGEIVYSLPVKADSVSIGAVINEKRCPASDKVEISSC
ncbi:MAG: hypothetical protein WC533_01075 [Candidatus Pacearchaeota archaeon]